MATSQSLHPRRKDGSPLDATFEVTSIPVFDVVYHHKAGGRGTSASVNADYNEGLDLLLARMGDVGCSIWGIAVDSSVARKLPAEKRELHMEFPIALTPRTDVARLRRAIGKAQTTIARRPSAKPGGGNSQRTIRITLMFDQWMDHDALAVRLVAGTEPAAK